MTLEDVMNFHHIHNHSLQISGDGSWIAYAAWPDRGDGYGVVVSADGRREYRVDRAENPRFSAGGRWALFTQRAPFTERESARGSQQPSDAAVIVDTSNGHQLVYEDVKQAGLSQVRDLLFVHHAFVEDTLLSDTVNEQLKGAGTVLVVRDLENQWVRPLSFVDQWSVDSLATTLVYTRKDTTDLGNGLYALSLAGPDTEPLAIDTAGHHRFGRFTWHEGDPMLAYMRAADLEKDTAETASLFRWRPGQERPDALLGQQDVREGYFLPFDNSLSWTRDGERLFFGVRPERFAARPEEDPAHHSVIDSLRAGAEVDVWHGEDPLIKTHEKESWNRVRRQNLLSVYHMTRDSVVWLADGYHHQLEMAPTGDHALLGTTRPYEKRITWEGWFRDVYVINLYTGQKDLVLEEMQGRTSLSPGGDYLVYFLDKDWHVYETRTGERRNLTAGIDAPFWVETHDRPSTLPSYPLAGWVDDGESALVYDRYDIWRFNVRTGQAENITAGKGRENGTVFRIRKMDGEPLYREGERLFLDGFNEETKVRAIYTARIGEEGADKLHDTGQALRLRRLSDDGETLLFTNESQHIFPDLWVSRADFRRPVKLSNLQEQVEQFNWGRAELVQYHSADGVPLQGVLIKPGDYEPGKQYPVFVYYYETFSQRLHDFNQTVINHRPGFGYYTSNGYVVYLPDIHFVEGRPGMSAVKSLVPAVQAIIDMGVADPAAIGLHGHSWSGYQTAYVVTQTDLFAAAIAGAPVSNMTSAYGGIRWGSGLARLFQYETGQSRLGASIFDRRYLYIENSPLFYAHEINTPLLIMHGDADEAVPWEQSIELYLAMRRAGKDVIFLQYRDELHHLQKYPNKIDYTIRMKEYFDHHLRGKEAPEWIGEGVPYER